MHAKALAVVFGLLAAYSIQATSAMAQTHAGGHAHRGDASGIAPSPYTDYVARPLKALSDQQIADLEAGRGMGLALAAELNGYPGPTHVLELADQLALTDPQRQQTDAMLAAMKVETIPIGKRIVALETELDQQFATRKITPSLLEAAVSRIGELQADLRSAHLRYHLAMVSLLSPVQVNRYRELRGYAEPAAPSP